MRRITLLGLGLVLTCSGCVDVPVPGGSSANPDGLAGGGINLSPQASAKIGQRIWKNECGGTVAGLTSWNAGENFASLGIGHFIWYPAGVNGPYEESFPSLLAHLQRSGVRLPEGLTPQMDCPWPTKQSFTAALNGPQLTQLRNMLAATVPQQTEFLANRFLRGTGKIIDAAPAAEKEAIAGRIKALSAVPAGIYAMMDYTNFKGEGVNPSERYQGQGWGLLQVLQAMRGQPQGQAAAVEFSRASKEVLGRRISLAPKNESQWRAGWFSRCDGYGQPF
jgi:hypothetical protein